MCIDFKKLSCIGILGGTFNPVHNGHLMLAQRAKERLDELEKVIFMPNNITAYKDNSCIVDNVHRLNMLRIAAAGLDFAEVSDMELSRGGVTYTVDTLEQIKVLNSQIKIYFIVGADSLYAIEKWHDFEKIFPLCTLLVAVRDTVSDLPRCADELKHKYGADIMLLHSEEVRVSSTDIRAQLTEGIIPDKMLPAAVVDYILDNKLYKGV